MAKSKSKGAKTIAGVKVPKNLRTRLAPVVRVAEHPIVADLIAAGIAAASAAIANSRVARDAADKAGDEMEDVAAATTKGARKSGKAVRAIAVDFARHFIDAYDAGPSKASKARPKAKSGKKKSKP
jgi:tRNA A37 threonylcarbamoyladenosine synthetase subunit TsaC/SUA5/YrdC